MVTRSLAPLLGALALSLAACSGGSSGSFGGGIGGSSMYVQSCTLGCTNGLGGQQVSCQILNTFENADVSIAFSQPVNLQTANSTTFRLIDIQNGQTPNGTYVLDPNDSRRLIFRPQLIFDVDGEPIFGFGAGRTYQVLIPGQSQGDLPPFIESLGGRPNQSRLTCQITTAGIADPVPGAPKFEVFVQDALGQTLTADGQVDVPSGTPIVIVFDDLMKLGSLLVPSDPFAPSPSISVKVDPDGNLTDTSDQFAVAGQLSFQVDLDLLRTTITFVPSGGLPSGGSGPTKRKIVVDVSSTATDLSDKGVVQGAPKAFEPEVLQFAPVTIDESFSNLSNLEIEESGLGMWGQGGPFGNMVVPGRGGGSGRLGALEVGSSETVTLITGPIAATGTIAVFANPCESETLRVDGVDYAFCTNPANCPPGYVPVGLAQDSFGGAGDAVLQTVDEFIDRLRANSSSGVTFEAHTPTFGAAPIEIVVRATVPGAAGNAIELGGPAGSVSSSTALCAGAPASALFASGLFLSGGLDGASFAPGALLDNTDFGLGQVSAPITVTDGVFEFSHVRVAAGGRLLLRGPNPARLFARGRFAIEPGALVDLTGESPPLHIGWNLDGEPGAPGGPGAGSGGAGGDRPDSSGSGLIGVIPPVGGLANPGAGIDGRPGQGLGAVGNVAAGSGGPAWPDVMPSDLGVLGTLDAVGMNCEAFLVPGPGSGGAYATDGQPGTPFLPLVDLDLDGTPEALTAGDGGTLFAPDFDGDMIVDTTPGGDATQSVIEAPGAPADVRRLDPDAGDLRGGSGGAGGGANAYGTVVSLLGADCVDPANEISTFATASGGSGGGGGGAAQFQAGERLELSGFVDASGGAGGDGFVDPNDPELGRFQAAPGGGGSGGAILAQGNLVQIAGGAPRWSVQGGSGGNGLQQGTGGQGGAGLIRVEDAAGGVDPATIAGLSLPFPDPVDPVMYPNSESILSIGAGAFAPDPNRVPGSFSGVQSCWLDAGASNVFGLTFDADDAVAGTFGWSLDLVVDVTGNPTVVSYRDPALNGGFPLLSGQSWQQFLGEELQDGVAVLPAPFVIRFQGAKSTQPQAVGCDLILSSDLIGATPWVRHPADLNSFSPRPDRIRFAIVFDSSHPLAGTILGARGLTISAVPD